MSLNDADQDQTLDQQADEIEHEGDSEIENQPDVNEDEGESEAPESESAIDEVLIAEAIELGVAPEKVLDADPERLRKLVVALRNKSQQSAAQQQADPLDELAALADEEISLPSADDVLEEPEKLTEFLEAQKQVLTKQVQGVAKLAEVAKALRQAVSGLAQEVVTSQVDSWVASAPDELKQIIGDAPSAELDRRSPEWRKRSKLLQQAGHMQQAAARDGKPISTMSALNMAAKALYGDKIATNRLARTVKKRNQSIGHRPATATVQGDDTPKTPEELVGEALAEMGLK